VTDSDTDQAPQPAEQPTAAQQSAAAPALPQAAPEAVETEPVTRYPEAGALPEPVFTPFSLTVGDGFKFGCGFTMALVIAGLIGLLALSLVFLLASLVGAPLPIGR
jgi:hypothetical protein